MPRCFAIAAVLLLAAPPGAAAAGAGVPASANGAATLSIADSAAAHALRLRGVPYLWAGSTRAGFDCSGFTRFVYATVGITLPHSSYAQWGAGRHVRRADLRPGDLVFFNNLSHVGLYLGHGRFIHAPHTGSAVAVAALTTGWYAQTYTGAVRIPGSQAPLPPRPHTPTPNTPQHDLPSWINTILEHATTTSSRGFWWNPGVHATRSGPKR
jgi:hypothetical protein